MFITVLSSNSRVDVTSQNDLGGGADGTSGSAGAAGAAGLAGAAGQKVLADKLIAATSKEKIEKYQILADLDPAPKTIEDGFGDA